MTGAACLRCFVVGLALAGGVAYAAPFTNGGFEEGVWPTVDVGSDGSYGLWYDATTPVVDGWQVVSGLSYSWHETAPAGTVSPIYPMASEGNRSVDLNGNATGGIQQTFDTVVGDTYVVTFDASRHFLSEGVKQFSVEALNGASVLATKSVTLPETMGLLDGLTPKWQTNITLVFTATGSATTLRFLSLSGAVPGSTYDQRYMGPMIDNVRVSNVSANSRAVPSLGGAALLALSVLLAVFGLRARRV